MVCGVKCWYKTTTMQVCRTCLSRHSRMCTIVNTPMQMFYEQITKIPLKSQTGKPSRVCNTCYLFLRQCHEFMENAIIADDLLQQISKKGNKITKQEIAIIDKTRLTFSKSSDNVRRKSGRTKNVVIPNVKCERQNVKEEMEDENITMSATDVSEDGYSSSHFGIKKEEIKIKDTQLKSQRSFELGHEVERVLEKCGIRDASVPMTRNSKRASKRRDISEEQPPSEDETGKQFIYIVEVDDDNFKLEHSPTKESSPQRHDDATHRCIQCEKKFKCKSLLTRHMIKHTGERRHPCSYCGKLYSHLDGLRQHIKRLHTFEKRYSCCYCGKNFLQRNGMVNHERVHTGEKPFECYCGEAFSTKVKLKTHTLKVHTGEKPYACQYCGKRFYEKNNLGAHIRRHRRFFVES